MAGSLGREREHVRGRVWLVLCLALAVHVVDEALSGFVPQANNLLRGIAREFQLSGAPQLSFAGWLVVVSVAVLLLLMLTGSVSRRASMTRLFPHAVAWVLLANGLGHIAVSVSVGRMMAGVLSSPLLLLVSIWALARLRHAPGSAAVAQGAVA